MCELCSSAQINFFICIFSFQLLRYIFIQRKKSMLLSFSLSPFLHFPVTNYSFNLESAKETEKLLF